MNFPRIFDVHAIKLFFLSTLFSCCLQPYNIINDVTHISRDIDRLQSNLENFGKRYGKPTIDKDILGSQFDYVASSASRVYQDFQQTIVDIQAFSSDTFPPYTSCVINSLIDSISSTSQTVIETLITKQPSVKASPVCYTGVGESEFCYPSREAMYRTHGLVSKLGEDAASFRDAICPLMSSADQRRTCTSKVNLITKSCKMAVKFYPAPIYHTTSTPQVTSGADDDDGPALPHYRL